MKKGLKIIRAKTEFLEFRFKGKVGGDMGSSCKTRRSTYRQSRQI